MNCPRCGSDKVTVQVVTDSSRVRKRGCLWGLGRMLLVVCTCGLWLLIGKSKEKVNVQNHKEAICQNCGNSWTV